MGGMGATCFFPSKSALVAKMHVNVSYSTPVQTIELSFLFCYQFLNLEFQHAHIPWRLIQSPTSTAQILLPFVCAAPASGTREGNLDPMRCDSCLPIACTARQPGRQHALLAASIQTMGKDAQLDMFVGTSA